MPDPGSDVATGRLEGRRAARGRCGGLVVLGRGAALAALLLAGCVTVPPAEVPFELPDGFVASDGEAGSALSERWWEDFGDPRLNGFVETALVGNPGLAQAAARTRMAEAQAREAARYRRLPPVPNAAPPPALPAFAPAPGGALPRHAAGATTGYAPPRDRWRGMIGRAGCVRLRPPLATGDSRCAALPLPRSAPPCWPSPCSWSDRWR